MRRKWFILFVIVVLIIPQLIMGQENSSGQTFLSRSSQNRFGNSAFDGLSLLDPSKFSMSHTYSMSYFLSGGKGKMIGLYMNTMNYQFSQPLSLTVHVGYVHQPFAQASSNSMISNSALLSGFELTYRPRKNFILKVEYGTIPLRNDPYYRYGSWYDW